MLTILCLFLLLCDQDSRQAGKQAKAAVKVIISNVTLNHHETKAKPRIYIQSFE